MYIKNYDPTGWQNDNTTPVAATALENIEAGIANLYNWTTKVFGDTGTSVVAFDKVFAQVRGSQRADKVFVDTTGGAFNLVLPATPAVGDMCKFVDVAGNFATANFTVNVAAGDKFMGQVDDFLLLTTNSDYVDITYSGTMYGWVITSKP